LLRVMPWRLRRAGKVLHSMDRWIDGAISALNRHRTHGGHPARPLTPLPSRRQIEAAAEMFRALGDPERLRLLLRLAESEACVSELAEDEGEKITTMSARLKILSIVRLVRRRREAKHVFYALADEHVLPLVRNAIDHAAESRTGVSADFRHGKDRIP
jgi:ArsR family transcriptional regulator, lead/cadmium/zinc/bismuth-responsive transcriptional repressor